MDASGNGSFEVDVDKTEKLRSYHFELNYLDPNGETRTYAANKEVRPNT